jgi:hypothetical protein
MSKKDSNTPKYGIVKFDSSRGGALSKLDPAAQEKALQKLQTLAEEGKQLREHRGQEIDAVSNDLRVKLAIALDFTASTSGDIETFRTDSVRLMKQLQATGNVSLLPVAFKGQPNANWGAPSFYAETGPVDNLKWFEGVSHVTNSRSDAPVVEGLRRAVNSGFFVRDNSSVNAVLSITDSGFSLDTGYEEVIKRMQDLDITYVSFIAPNGFFNAESYVDSHKRAICDRLGQKGKVVVRGQSEMDPIDLTAAIIKNELQNKLREIQATRSPQQAVSYKPVSLANFLRQIGQAKQADQVHEGLMLPKKK